MKYHRIGENGSKVAGKRSAGIVFTDGHALLLLKRSGDCPHTGTWAIPGGKAKDGETDIGNAVRETLEETGLGSLPGYRFDSFVSHDGRKRFTAFLYRVPETFEDLSLSDEHSDWQWVQFDDLDDFSLHPRFKENLPRYLQAIRKKVTSFSEWTTLTSVIGRFATKSM